MPNPNLSVRSRRRVNTPARPSEDRAVAALADLWRACAHADVGRVPQAVVERAAQTLSAHSASILLRETGGDTLRMAASIGLPQEIAQSVTLLVGEKIAGRVAATGVPIKVSGDPRRHPLLTENSTDISPRSEVSSALCVPVSDATGNVLGVLSVSRYLPAKSFADADLSLATLFAAYAGSRLAEERLRVEAATRGQEFVALERLAASVAHEMRNPLSSIKGAAQYVQSKLFEAEYRVCHEFMGLVVEESDSLARLASDLIEWARPSQSVRECRDLFALVRGQVALLSPEFEKIGVAVRLCGDDVAPAFAPVDAATIGRAVRNLLLNAAEASVAGTNKPAVVVSVFAQSVENITGYSIAVEDSGAGIATERRVEIWEPFVTDKARGVGLGLTQVRATALAHGGSADCADGSLGGARFTLFVPSDSYPPSEKLS